jgi:16S rRNA (uracil1498-N3)-methyltransferase
VARFFLNQEQVTNTSVKITGEDAHHIARVLRHKVGDEIECAPNTGEIHIVRLTHVEANLVEGVIVDSFMSNQESPLVTRLYQGLAKGDKMDFVIQKAVELGVSEIIPYTSRYTVVKLNQAQQLKRLERWERIAREAAKQSKRARLPTISPDRTVKEISCRIGFPSWEK